MQPFGNVGAGGRFGYLVTGGDFHVLEKDVVSARARKVKDVSDYIQLHENASKKAIAEFCRIARGDVDRYATESGWECVDARPGKAGVWQRVEAFIQT